MRAFIAGLACAFTFSSAGAEPVENEALAMRLIFEDCLGYVAEKKTPFAGLDLQPLDAETYAGALPAGASGITNRYWLLNGRYQAIWGQDAHARMCMVQTAVPSDEPMLLLVNPEGFLDRIAARAAAAGMTEADIGDGEFTPLYIANWHEPRDDEKRALSLTVAPTGAVEDGSLVDAGLFIMGADPDWKPKGD